MPLNTANMTLNGHLTSADMLQYANLLTGVMTDQPVRIANTVSVGASPLMLGAAAAGPYIAPTLQGGIVFGTNNAGRWSIALGGDLQTQTDGAYNIGGTAANRPNNIYITGALSVGSTNERVRSTGTNLNVESADGQLTVAGITATYAMANAYWDGAAYQRFSTAVASFLCGVNQTSFIIDGVAAGANPITWVGLMSLDHSGNMSIGGSISTPTLAVTTINFPNGGYIQSYASPPYVQINQLTVTPGPTALASLAVNGSSALNGATTVGGALSVAGVIYGANVIDLANTSVQRCATYYGLNNSTYITNDGTNWSFTGSTFNLGAAQISSVGTIIVASDYSITFAVNGYYWKGLSGVAVVLTNGSIQMNGGTLYFEASRGVYIQWNGGQLLMSYPPISVNGYYYFTSTAIAFYWNGTGIQSSHVFYSPGLYCSSRLYTNGTDWGWSNNLGGNTYSNGVFNTTLQICAYGAYNSGANNNAFMAPNLGDYRGQGLAWQWATWACVDHAQEYGLRLEPIADPLCYVRHITGWSYDHPWMENDKRGPVLDEDGAICFTPTYGFKPSEVAQYLPELVGYNSETGEPESIDLDRMGVVLWEAFKQYACQTDARLEQLERTRV
jgi:hypothetical protein